MNAASDADLALAAQRGSEDAFAAIVARNHAAVRGFLRRACGDWADADDLAQETFVSAWTHLAGYEGRASLRSWLCGIAYKKLLGHVRARARAAAREDLFMETHAAAGEALSPDELLDLARAMAALPIDQRAAVALCLAQGFSHSEAAEALGLPLGTVKSHVGRGRAKLLEALRDERI
jgi:RNA polymerase sigma-70 factor (ECF subfamily)